MGRLVLAIDPGMEVGPVELAAAWNRNDETSAVGTAVVEAAPPGDFFGVMELVVIPAGVGLAVNGITAMISSLVAKLQAGTDPPELEIAETTRPNGDRIVVVRLRGARQ
jgi:hypothetical protein